MSQSISMTQARDLVTITRAIPIWMALALALAACAPKPPAHVGTVGDAEEVSMAKCTFLKELSNTKSWSDRMLGHVFVAYDQKALDDARFDVRRQAKEIGATHLVWLGGAEVSILLGLAPFAVFFALMRLVSPVAGLGAALAVSLLLCLRALWRGESLKVVEIGSLVLFALLTAASMCHTDLLLRDIFPWNLPGRPPFRRRLTSAAGGAIVARGGGRGGKGWRRRQGV